jgi:clan AA aspartic protease
MRTKRVKYKRINSNFLPVIKIKISGPKKAKEVDALLDTGASTTTITPELCEELSLEKIAETPVVTASNTEIVGLYKSKIIFVGIPFETYVASCKIPKEHPIRVLIGRDLMQFFKIVFDGPKVTIEIKSDLF